MANPSSNWASVAQQPLQRLEANFLAERPRGVAKQSEMSSFMLRSPPRCRLTQMGDGHSQQVCYGRYPEGTRFLA